MTGKYYHNGQWKDWDVPVWTGANHVKNLMSNDRVPQIVKLEDGSYLVNSLKLFDDYSAKKKDVKMVGGRHG